MLQQLHLLKDREINQTLFRLMLQADEINMLDHLDGKYQIKGCCFGIFFPANFDNCNLINVI